jgi:hypothetical protein
MEYTIGCRTMNKDGERVDGIYVFGKYLPYISRDLEKVREKGDAIYVISTLEDAQKYVQYLSRRYRYEFRNRAKNLNVSVDNFGFYLMKLSDKRFKNYALVESKHGTKLKKSNDGKYKFEGTYCNVHLKSLE